MASYCFDRDQDWRALVSYVENQQAEPTLGVASGRRRQGKTYLAEFSRFPVQFGNWDDALPYLFSLADDRPLPLIIDEIPLLIRASPQLPSMLLRHLDSRWYLLAEAVAAREPGTYHSVLGAIASGNTTNGGIASFVGKWAKPMGMRHVSPPRKRISS